MATRAEILSVEPVCSLRKSDTIGTAFSRRVHLEEAGLEYTLAFIFCWTHRHGEILEKKKTVSLDEKMVPTMLDLIAPELSVIISNGLQVDLVTVDLSNDDGHEPVKLALDYPQARLLFSLLEQSDFFARHRH